MNTPTYEYTEDERTIRPDSWAMMLNDVQTKLDLREPDAPSILFGNKESYCEKWFRISTGYPSEKVTKRFEQLVDTVPQADLQIETYAFLREYHDMREWQKEQTLIRFAQDHQYAPSESGPKSKVGRAIYEWPPTARNREPGTAVWHEPARYIMDVPGKGRIDLGMTSPDNEDWGPVLHGSPDKAMQAILTRIRRRIGGPFNAVFSKLYHEQLEIRYFETNSKGEELRQPFSLVNFQDKKWKILGNANTIHDIIVPAPITAMVKGKWIVALYPMLNAKHVLTNVPDPDKFGRYLTRSEIQYNIIAEPSQPRMDDKMTYDPRGDDPLPDTLDISYLDGTDIKWDVLNGFSSIDKVEEHLQFEINSHIEEIKPRVANLTRIVASYFDSEGNANEHKVRDAGTKFIRAQEQLQFYTEELEKAKGAFAAFQSDTATAGQPDPEDKSTWLTLRGRILEDGSWTTPARSALAEQSEPHMHQRPDNLVHDKPIRTETVKQAVERLTPMVKIVTPSVIERGKPAITKTGKRTFRNKHLPRFSVRHDASPALRHTLAHLALTGSLPPSHKKAFGRG
jgi:hypothetical protein